MQHSDVSAIGCIDDLVACYGRARRRFLIDMERCTLKGWPDKKREIDTSFRLQNAFVIRDGIRFRFLRDRGEFGAGRWRLLKDISDRLNILWKSQEETYLIGANLEYVELVKEIERLKLAVALSSIGDALRDVARDGEAIHARNLLFAYVQDLNKVLSGKWNDSPSEPTTS